MFYLKKEIGLTYDNEVFKTADIIFKVQSEIDVVLTGVLTLTNGIKITIPLQKEGALYKGKFTISKDIIAFLNHPKFSIYKTDLNHTSVTNSVTLVFDIQKITLDIKKEVGEEVKHLFIRLAELESQLSSLTNKGILKNAPVINKHEIKPGMIPVATATGEFTAAYPFADIVKKINGVSAVDEKILLTLAEVPYEANGKSAKEMVQLLLEIAKGQAEAIQLILQTQDKLIQDIKELKLDYAEHKKTAMF